MKRKWLPALVAAAVLVLIAGLLWWWGRPQVFSDVFALSGVDGLTCRVDMASTTVSGEFRAADLEPGEISELLSQLEGQTLRRPLRSLEDRLYAILSPNVVTGHASSMDWSVSLYFREEGTSRRCEIMLLGDRILVNDLYDSWWQIYTLSGGQAFQESLADTLYGLTEPEA